MPALKPLISRFASVKTVIAAPVCAVLLLTGFPPRLAGASGSQLPGSLRSQSSTGGFNDTAFRIAEETWGQTLSYNPYAPAGYEFGDLVQMTLADLSSVPTSKLPNKYFYPEIAKSWTLGKRAITVHLQPHAKWTTGAPLTSTDVATSLLLAGEDYNQAWSSISKIATPDSHTVVIDLRPDSVPLDVWTDVVQIPIIPASQYHQLVPPQAQQWLVQYWSLYKAEDPTGASINAANNSPAGKEIAKYAAEIPKFSPKTLVGDGAYTLENANTNEILLKKWPGFWHADKITTPYVELLSVADLGTTFGDLMGGRVDAETYSIFPDPDTLELEHSQYGHFVKAVAPQNASLIIFHLADYPYNLLNVRKALGYLLNRSKLDHLESGGSLEQNQPIEVPDGLTNPMNNQYLTKHQLHSLNSYDYSPAKATKLLEAVGFHKRGGKWYTSRGKLWTINFYVQSSQGRMDNDALAITAMWRQAGIKAIVDEVSPAVFYEEDQSGDYAVSDNFNYEGSVNPLEEIANTLITYNYPIADAGTGTSSSHAAIGIGPVANVPGLGKVNIESALNKELATAQPSQWSKYVWDWTRFENEEVPGFAVTSTDVHLMYSTSRYVDFPPVSVQRYAGFNIVEWMQLGYLKLRKASS